MWYTSSYLAGVMWLSLTLTPTLTLTLTRYTSSYLAGVMWLSLRLSPLYPASLTPLDPALCAATSMPQRDRTPGWQTGSQAD